MKPANLLPKTWSMPDAIRSRLGREPGPQRAMLEEGHLLIILHELPQPDESKRRAALFWRKPEGEWFSNQQGNGLTSLNAYLAGYEQRLEELEQEEEVALSASDYHQVLEHLAPVLRATRGIHRALQQARDMVKTDGDLINLRDQAAGIERMAELLLQDAEFGLNFTMARQAEAQAATAEKMAATAHRLNLLAALFFPVTALASIFGMNFSPGIKDSPSVFWMVCLVGMVFGGVLLLNLGKRR